MTSPRRAFPRGVFERAPAWLLAIAGVVAFVVVFCLAFEWTWFRPLIQRYVQTHGQRRIDFDELHIGLTRRLQPTVTLRGLVIENVPWAVAKLPLLQAGELRFDFAWRSLVDEHVIVERLVLRDAQVDLERLADGRRNWRVTDPENVGAGRFRILALEAERSSLRFVHRGIGLDVTSRMTTLAAPETMSRADQSELTLTKHLHVEGKRQSHRFEANIQVGDQLTFLDTGIAFPLRGELTTGSTRLQVDGRIADIAQLHAVDTQVRLGGARLADLAIVWPGAAGLAPGIASLSYHVSGALQTADGTTSLTRMQAQLGESEFTGDASWRRAGDAQPRPRLHAALHSPRLDVATLISHLDAAAPPRASVTTSTVATSSNEVPALQRLDGDLRLTVDQLLLPRVGKAGPLQLNAVLVDGSLDVDPLQLDFAGGRVQASAHLRSASAPPGQPIAGHSREGQPATPSTLAAKVTLADLDLARLLPASPPARRLTGRLDAQAALNADGASPAAWLASATGSATAGLRHATIADRLEAELSLSGGALLSTLVGADRQIPVQCAAMNLALRPGRLSASRLGLATERVSVAGRGTVDLQSRQLDLLLTPTRKTTALLALDRSIHIDGPLTAVHIGLVDRVEMTPAQGCDSRTPALQASR